MDDLNAGPPWVTMRRRPTFTPASPRAAVADDAVPEIDAEFAEVCPTALLVSPIVMGEEMEVPGARVGGTGESVRGVEIGVAKNGPFEGVADVGSAASVVTPLVGAGDGGGAGVVVTPMVVGAPSTADGDGEFQPEDGEASESDDEWTGYKKKHKHKSRGSSSARSRATCTQCKKPTGRWPGTLCAPCGLRWRETGEPADAKTCGHCGTADTCRWLRGPEGPQTLCNACGKRWALRGDMTYLRDPVTQKRVKPEPRGAEEPSPESPATTARASLRASPSCAHCGVTQSRLWRTGPAGRRTLCDECGIRWKEGKEPLPRQDAAAQAQAADEEDGDDEDFYEPPRPKKRRKVAPPAPFAAAAPVAPVAADDAAEGATSTGGATATATGTQAAKQAANKIEELEKACELLQFGLNNETPNIEQLQAVNQFVIIGLRNLKASATRLLATD